MDCCGQGKSKETEKDVKDVRTGQFSNENNQPKEHNHGGGCCGGAGMWLHLIVMAIMFIAIWYFSKG